MNKIYFPPAVCSDSTMCRCSGTERNRYRIQARTRRPNPADGPSAQAGRCSSRPSARRSPSCSTPAPQPTAPPPAAASPPPRLPTSSPHLRGWRGSEEGSLHSSTREQVLASFEPVLADAPELRAVAWSFAVIDEARRLQQTSSRHVRDTSSHGPRHVLAWPVPEAHRLKNLP